MPVAQAAELEHSRAVSDFFHLRAAQVVLQLWMPDQHDGQLPAAFGNQLDETLQSGQRLWMQIVRVVDEERHRLLGAPEELLKVAHTPLGMAWYLDRLFLGEVIEQRRFQQR